MTHTPGPWAVRKNGGNHWGMREVAGPSVNVIGFTIATDVNIAKAVRIEGDVRLIAAAPDLLDVARMLVDVGQGPSRFTFGDCVMRARAAIAKTEDTP